jgi:hypothetical protein
MESCLEKTEVNQEKVETKMEVETMGAPEDQRASNWLYNAGTH